MSPSWSQRRELELTCSADESDAADGGVVRGDRSWFRPGQLLVDRTTARLYADSLARNEKQDRGFDTREGLQSLDLIQVQLDPATDVIDLTRWIELDAARRDLGHQVVVGPNFCWRGEPIYHGGPGGEPSPEKRRDMPGAGKKRDPNDPCDIATLDTGIVDTLPRELMAALRPDKNDADDLDVDQDGLLDTQNGHGSFVAGVVHQLAPELLVDPGKVLDSTGLGDDASVTRELLQTRAPVVNMSLGGYTEDDRAPVAMASVIRLLAQTTVLVASAGNNGSDRPFWPAAFKGVVAVAAYDSTGQSIVAAKFSNYGSWVDVCAPGVGVVSTFATFPPDPNQAKAGEPVFEGWARWDGTSFAAPQVAAVLAQLVQSGATARDAVARFLDQECSYDAALVNYGLVHRPRITLT